MSDNNRVTTLTVRAKEENIDTVARKLGGLAAAADNAEKATEEFARSTDTSAKQLGTIARSLDNLEKNLSGSPRAWREFEKGAQIASRALEAGKLDAQSYSRILTELQTKLQKSIAPKLGLDVNQSGLAKALENTKQVSAASRMAARDILLQAQASEEAAREQQRASEIVAQQVAKLRAEIDPLSVAQAKLNSEIAEYNALAKAGHITTGELATATAQANTRFINTSARLGQVGNDLKLTNFQVTNLGYQINDIGTMLAMGASPFQVLSSQAGQVYQALGDGPGGVAGSLGAIKRSALGLASSFAPMLIAFGGIGAAATVLTALSDSASNDFPKASAALDAHAKVVDRVSAAYEGFGKKLAAIRKESRDGQLVDLSTSREGLQSVLQGQLYRLQNFDLGRRDVTGAPVLLAIQGQVEDFLAALSAGEMTVTQFREELQKLFNDPATSEAQKASIKQFLSMTEAISETEKALKENAAATDEVANSQRRALAIAQSFSKGLQEQRSILGGYAKDMRNDVQIIEDAYQQLIRLARTEADIRSADELKRNALQPIQSDARTTLDDERFKRSQIGLDAETAALRENAREWEKRIAEVEGNAEAVESLTQASIESANAIREQFKFDAAEKVRDETKARKEATDARIEGIKSTVEAMEAEVATIGMSEAAAAAYRFEVQALAEAKKAAEGGVVSPDEIQAINAASDRIRNLTEQTIALREAEQQRKSVQEAITDLDFQASLVGMSEVDKQIAITLDRLKLTYDSLDGKRIADGLRYLDQVERQNEALEKQQDILNNVASTFLDIFDSDAADSFFDKIVSGLSDIGKQFAELGKQNLMEALFGSVSQYTAAAPQPGQRSVAPAGFPSGYQNQPAAANQNTSIPVQALNRATGSLEAAAKAIRTIESGSSGGNYSAMGPTTRTGDRAHGAYQVMGANIPSWSKAAIGRTVSNIEFLSSPDIQDAVFQHRFGGYAKKYGWEGASQAWFGGEGSVGKLNRKDVLGTSIGGYGSRFSQLFDQHGGNSSDAQIRTTQAVSDGYIDANRKLASGAVPGVGWDVQYDTSARVQGAQAGLFGPRGQAGLQALGAGAGAFFGGYQSGSPLAGGLGGAMSGYGAAGSISSALGVSAGLGAGLGIVGGAALGILGGIFGARQKRKQEHQNRANEWAQMQPQYLEWQKQFQGYGPNSGLRDAWNSKTSEFDNFVRTGAAAWKYGSGNSSAEFQNVANTMFAWEGQMRQSFQDAFEPTLAELKAGFGFDGPFLKARDSVRELEERIDTFIDDTLYTFGTGNDALSQAKEASRDFALTTLSGADGLSDVAKAIQDLEGRADRMSPLLMKLGMSATEAADAIENALSTGLNRLRDNFNESVQSSINTLDGKSYLNDFRELFVSVDQMFSDASRLGADADLVQEYFAKQAQAFVDNAELSGDAFNDLLVVFPRLIGLVEQFSSTVDRATELQAYSAELQAYSAAELDRAVSDLDSARQNLNAAYQREKSEIESLIQRHEAFKESLQSFLKNMLLSEDSPLSGEDKFLKAQADFRELQQKALAGDQEAQDKLLEASQSYLDEARSYYASSEAYYAAFSEVQNVLKAADVKAGQQITEAKAQLSALEKQVSKLIDIDDGIQSVANAMKEFVEASKRLADAQAGLNGVRDYGSNPVRNQAIVRDLQAAGLNFSGNFGSGGFGAWLQSLSTEDRARAQAIADRYIHMGYANGGLVSGPGSGTSDSIRAKLSNGEYVVPAARVPANFNALERMRIGKSPDNDNSSLINEVRSLRDEVRSLKSVTYEGSRNISEKVGEGNDIAKRQSGITKKDGIKPMIYLVEFDAVDENGNVITERFGTSGYTTRPSDTPSNTHFEERVINPGNFEQSMFSSGRTSGEGAVGFGVIELAIGDDGGGDTADRLVTYAVDGRQLRIYGLESDKSPWTNRSLLFSGTMEQIEFGWTVASIRVRDKLAEFRKSLQPTNYLGTTVSGGMNEAEGTPDDLKDRPKPLLFGLARNIPATLANRFDRIYQVSSRPVSNILGVYDMGVPLTKGIDHPDVTSLRSATIAGGVFDTCLTKGLFRVAGQPEGELTADAIEGQANEQSTSDVVSRILQFAGYSASDDYSQGDLDSLKLINPSPVGVYLTTQPSDLLTVLTQLLDSIGGYMVPNSSGILRFGRLSVPNSELDDSVAVLDTNVILDGGDGLERIATSDEGNGVPSHKITVSYNPSWLVQSETDLDPTAATEERKAFVSLPYRQIVREDESVKTRHLLASEMTFATFLVNEQDANSEADRRFDIYRTRRDRYKVPLASSLFAEFNLNIGDKVLLKLKRFRLDNGKPMVVTGIEVDLLAGITTLDLWG